MPAVDLVARRFALWLAVCSASAAPSFVLARSAKANVGGMVAAIVTFAVVYTILTCTERFERVRRRPFVRDTLYLGYGLRVGLSLAICAVMATNDDAPFAFLYFPDMVCGIFSLGLVNRVALERNVETTFVGAFVVTCVQGACLNGIVFAVMAIAYGLQRAFRRPPVETLRGFEVVARGE